MYLKDKRSPVESHRRFSDHLPNLVNKSERRGRQIFSNLKLNKQKLPFFRLPCSAVNVGDVQR
ncbi:hypothetical protein K443DRAFT_575886 [Laccaria amethystina LaAM-08-1]|uniref:Uncharacterized protein n=1 Tax=Laccaria amethystina LaAM-08-1 TaxID=1095629 RepID=A0A0C9XZM0_9AGAR|nr:hypothetical protein K443DRAFT_575886 [Laccaria amethystina LaAM-08-1]